MFLFFVRPFAPDWLTVHGFLQRNGGVVTDYVKRSWNRQGARLAQGKRPEFEITQSKPGRTIKRPGGTTGLPVALQPTRPHVTSPHRVSRHGAISTGHLE